jgi:alkaline phosphatase D
MSLDRRLLLKTGAFGLGALTLPGGAMAAMQAALSPGFSHGVASGEPGPTSVLLWTRFVADAADTKLVAEVSDSADFKKLVAGADTFARQSRDHIAKVVIEGLTPGKRYHYRFRAADGGISPVGQTRTLPVGKVPRYRMAVFSCSNLPFGWFNAYGHAATADDIDLVLHLGDYIYEYQRGIYPFANEVVAGRLIEPANECVALADYRLRYASYRMDSDLQALHARHPMLAMWDDHEFANDAYADGAQNHQANEGDWAVRKAAAEQAWREWMPVRERGDDIYWTSYAIGDLAEIQMTESRVSARSKQPGFGTLSTDSAEAERQLKTFRDDVWQDIARTMLGNTQEAWLAERFANPGKRWNIWAQQTLVGSLLQPPGAKDWLPANALPFVKSRVEQGALAAKIGLPTSLDSWDGYPAARARALAAAQKGNADLVVLTGDTHNGWAFDLSHGGKAAGVEFGGQSVSSPGLEKAFTGATADMIARALVATNPSLRWADAGRRGYMTVELTRDRAVSEFRFTGPEAMRSATLTGTKRIVAKHGRRKLDKV